jgi:TnpA family transposase
VNKKNSQRLQILSNDEMAELYAVPQFNATERSHYFLLPDTVLHSLKLMKKNGRNTSAKLWFILQYGYFKARHQFFHVSYSNIKDDVSFIMANYLSNDPVPLQLPSRRIQGLAKCQILKQLGYSHNTNKARQLVLKKARQLAKLTHSVSEIFGETIKYLEIEKMVLPSYTSLQDMIGAALKAEEQRLIEMVKQHLTKHTRQALQNLFSLEEGLYRITEIKLDAKSFQKKEMQSELAKLAVCRPIYAFSKKFIPILGLSRSMIEYYSSLAKLYRVARLRQAPQELSYLYLICYVQGRYERLTSNLIQGFIYYVDKYHQEAKNEAKTALPMLAETLDQHRRPIGKLIKMFTNKEIMHLPGSQIRSHAFKVMPKETILAVSGKLLNDANDKRKNELKLVWEYHRNNYQSILINLRPLFLEIDFESNEDGLGDLFTAAQFLKSMFKKDVALKEISLQKIPVRHIRPKLLLDLFTDANSETPKKRSLKKTINPWQYEFYIYRTIRENIKSSKIHVNSSVGYKSFEAEVNIHPDWQKKEKAILHELNNPILLRPIEETLTELESMVEPLIERTNRRVLSGENKHITLTRHRDGRIDWSLPYPKQNNEIDNPFYDSLEIKTISEVFNFVEQQCQFMRAFTHIKPRGAPRRKDYLGIKATILANGTLQGTNLFSKRSNLKYLRLLQAEQNYIRLATLRDAADIIVNNMINLPIFDLYDLGGKKHGSVDGTKKKTRRRLLRARYSKKYFGTDRGLVVMTMTLGHVPFVTEMIGANEHEGHFVYPMLFRNTSEIDPDIISTDTAGTNNVNDLMYYLIGKIHAPCYRSTAKKIKTLSGFKPLSHYNNLLIKPAKQVNTELIKDKWREILPILVSLLSHDTTQENIIKTLSSHDFKSKIKDAIWELNHILKSIHLLKDVDDPVYRQYIRTALNRGEAYHQILEKIMAVGGGDFRGMSELEVEIWNECARSIALIIIYYNMHLLSKLYENAMLRNDAVAVEFLKHLSPVASQHINISGLYEFSEVIENINVDNIVQALNKILKDTIKPSSG